MAKQFKLKKRPCKRPMPNNSATSRCIIYISHMRQLPNDWESGQIVRFKETLDRYVPTAGEQDLRGWEWYYFESLLHRDLQTLMGHTGAVYTMHWSPDERQIASGGKDGILRVWNTDSGRIEREFAIDSPIWSSAWSPDGHHIASVDGAGTARVHDLNSGTQILTIQFNKSATARSKIAYSADGHTLAIMSIGKSVQFFDAKSGEKISAVERTNNDGRDPSAIAYSPLDGRIAISSEVVGTGAHVEILDPDSKKVQMDLLRGTNTIYGLAWTRDAARLAASGYGTLVWIWDTTTGRLLQSCTCNGAIDTVAFSPDGKLLAGGTRSQRIEIWDADTGSHLNCLRGHLGLIREVGWSTNGGNLASAGDDGTIKIWNPATAMDFIIITRDQATSGGLAWSPDDKCVACGWSDGSVKIVEAVSGRILQTLRPSKTTENVRNLAWSPTGCYLTSSHVHEEIVWDMTDQPRPVLHIPLDGESLRLASA